jgi:hypothetical protein
MKKNILRLLIFFIFYSSAEYIYGVDSSAQQELRNQYDYYCHTPSDIYEHLPVLRELARESSSVIEIGVRSMVSTWGILQGLSENPSPLRSYLGIDLAFPPSETLNQAARLATSNEISFCFLKGNDMQIDLPYAEMLFIDSLHTYCHLTYELEKFSPFITKYLAMHDTSEPWGTCDDWEYKGNYSEYPPHFDRAKRGLWAAVEDFLERHPEWILHERRLNNHGFTVLQRIYSP